MKKIIIAILSIVMIIGIMVPAASAETVDYIVNMDFNEITKIESITFSNGAKSTLQIAEGWLPDNAKLIQDDGVQVLGWQRLNNQLGGFDINSIGTLTGNKVVFSITLKFDKLEKDAFLHVALINGTKWYYSFAITSDGSIVADYDRETNNGLDVIKTSVKIGQIDLKEYNTLSMVYDLDNNKQIFYVNGVISNERTGFRLGKVIGDAPEDITRFKIEHRGSDGDIDIKIKKVSVYNAEKPVEEKISAEDMAALKVNLKTQLEQYVDLNAYREADRQTIQSLIDEYKGKIDAADGGDSIYAEFEAAKKLIDAVMTDAEKTAAEELQAAKDAGKSELETLVQLENYSEENRARIESIISEAKTDIDAQTDMTALNKVLKIARNKILAVKTVKAEKEAEELANKKAAAKSELDGYIDVSVYGDEEKYEIERIILKAKKDIDAADDAESVDSILADAKSSLDGIGKLSDSADDGKKGCGGTVSIGILYVVLATGIGCIVMLRKRKA